MRCAQNNCSLSILSLNKSEDVRMYNINCKWQQQTFQTYLPSTRRSTQYQIWHIPIFCNCTKPNESVFVTNDIIEGTRTIFLNPWHGVPTLRSLLIGCCLAFGSCCGGHGWRLLRGFDVFATLQQTVLKLVHVRARGSI